MGMTALTAREEWRGEYERAKAEAEEFKKRATQCWKDKIEYNKKRRWLDALKALDNYHYCRDQKVLRAARAKEIKEQYGF